MALYIIWLNGVFVNSDQFDRSSDEPSFPTEAQRRLRGFGLHLAGYFVIMIAAVGLNFWLTPDRMWFVLPMVGWGGVLAIHAAYAMGLFKAFR